MMMQTPAKNHQPPSSGLGRDLMKDSKEGSPRFSYLQTFLLHKLQRLSVPVTAKLLRVSIVSAILPAFP